LRGTTVQLQSEAFTAQVQMAMNMQIPIIIHNVRSTDRIVQILKKHSCSVPVIFHGFALKHSTAQYLQDQGYLLSFGKHILSQGSAAAESFCKANKDLVLLETDDAPIGINDIYTAASKLWQCSHAELEQQIALNFSRTFAVEQ
jgi:TatD DNase family protein